jgi:uncharacterized protein
MPSLRSQSSPGTGRPVGVRTSRTDSIRAAINYDRQCPRIGANSRTNISTGMERRLTRSSWRAGVNLLRPKPHRRCIATIRATVSTCGGMGAERPIPCHLTEQTRSSQPKGQLMSHVYTAEYSIHGIGVFSSARFRPGEIILKIDDSRVVTDADPLDPAKGEFEHHCDYLASGKVVLMQAPERFINHHCEPNTYIRTISGDRHVVALREIRRGDEITYDYCINGDGDTAWDCSCKSPECRKRHFSGFFHLPVDVQARYLALLEDWFIAEYHKEVTILKRQIEEGLR